MAGHSDPNGFCQQMSDLCQAVTRPSLAMLHRHLARVGIDRSLNSLTINFQKTIQMFMSSGINPRSVRAVQSIMSCTGDEAKEAILKDSPDLQVVILPEQSPVTMDYRPDRVRVFVDGSGVVKTAPRTG